MQATSKDLRLHTKKILDAAMRGDEVVITYHGKPCAKIIPLRTQTDKDKTNAFCGMWEDRKDMKDVARYVRNIRHGRVV